MRRESISLLCLHCWWVSQMCVVSHQWINPSGSPIIYRTNDKSLQWDEYEWVLSVIERIKWPPRSWSVVTIFHLRSRFQLNLRRRHASVRHRGLMQHSNSPKHLFSLHQFDSEDVFFEDVLRLAVFDVDDALNKAFGRRLSFSPCAINSRFWLLSTSSFLLLRYLSRVESRCTYRRKTNTLNDVLVVKKNESQGSQRCAFQSGYIPRERSYLMNLNCFYTRDYYLPVPDNVTLC